MQFDNSEIVLRPPQPDEGSAIHQLVANSPPLDLNSVYSYYLLCSHFADTCVVAEWQGQIVGFISAYRPPAQGQQLFVWQVVVDSDLRGRGIAWRMLHHLLRRLDGAVMEVQATVNPSNTVSRGLFQRLATEQGSLMQESVFLSADAFAPASEHESEILLSVPLAHKIQEKQNANI
ncbi:MAG: diaminobutyrate acetyltransferase [Gammaproteobacteria bacterium]|nr:diaminobutyrate acetyltransferase [Gammaproteobacteria bacterium]